VPAEKNEKGEENIKDWPQDEVFQHLACLYIKYIDIYRKLEQCYDQIIHPQKRVTIRRTLECTITRICELKKDLIIFNPRPKSIYVHLDQLLFDLKYDPSIIEIPVPSYFKEDDRLPLDLKFKEKVEREGAKKAKKPKKPKKSKKKKDDDEEKKKPPIFLDEKQSLMSQLLKQFNKSDEPEVEVVQDPFSLDIEIIQAIRLIQKNDRGRQGRERLTNGLKMVHRAVMSELKQNQLRQGNNMDGANH
jgi:hypothetical protein